MVKRSRVHDAISGNLYPHALDVANGKQTKKPLGTSDNIFQKLFESGQSAECVTTEDGVISALSTKFETLCGWTKSQVVGTHFSLIIAPEYREQITTLYEKHGATPMSVSKLKTVIISNCGIEKNATLSIKAIPNTTYISITSLENSDLKYKTKKKRIPENAKVNGNLDGELAELLKREVALRRQLESTLKERAEFIRIVAHELRTPLTAMLAASDILCENITSEPLKKLAKQVNKGALDLSTRINELFDLAKGEVGMLKLRCQEIYPNRILAGTLDYFSAEAVKAKIALIPDWPDDLPPAWGDHRRITEILNNLIENAIKYTGEYGQITIRARNKNDCILFQVEDTGCGIPPDKQPLLFKAHHKFNTSGGKQDGMGLGLALSKMFVELHGGIIWAESKGNGSIFSFTIPLSSQKEGQVP